MIDIRQESPAVLFQYATIQSIYEVAEILAVVTLEGGLGGIQLVPQRVAAPYVKDYDADPANRPDRWCERFDLTDWAVFMAWSGEARVAGAVVAWNCPELDPRYDIAVLWDLRVAPTARGQGVATALFGAAEGWARERGARWLKVETQNNNVPACRFYASQGCTLGAIDTFAYASLPEEVALLWYKPLGDAALFGRAPRVSPT